MSKEDFIKLSRIIREFNKFADDICALFNTSEPPIDKPISDLYDWMLHKLGYTDAMLYDFDPSIDDVIYTDYSDEVISEYYDEAMEEIKNYMPHSKD